MITTDCKTPQCSTRSARLPNPINVRLDAQMKDAVERLSIKFHLSLSEIIRAAVREKSREWIDTGRIVISSDAQKS